MKNFNIKNNLEKKSESRMSEHIAMTPPMGWNSWDCYGASVTEDAIHSG